MLPNYFWHQHKIHWHKNHLQVVGLSCFCSYFCLFWQNWAWVAAPGKNSLASFPSGWTGLSTLSVWTGSFFFSYFLISCFSCSTGRCRMRSLARQRLAFINVSEKFLTLSLKLFLFQTNGRWYQCDVICVSNVIPRWSQCARRAWEETARRNNGEGGFLQDSSIRRLTHDGHLMPIMFTIVMIMLNITMRHSGVAPTAHLRDTKPTMRYQIIWFRCKHRHSA